MKQAMRQMELVFDLCYLAAIFFLGALTLGVGRGQPLGNLFGGMALLLGAGDILHLLPRIRSLRGKAVSPRMKGLGGLAPSVSATLYYLLLFQVWALHHPGGSALLWGRVAVGLALLRILLCLLPQNRWFEQGADARWLLLLRNLPFLALGVLVGGLFGAMPVPGLEWMPLAVGLSFGFYLPAALGARRVPMLGMLMMPKTLCYLWVQGMGLAAVFWAAQ